MGDSSGIETPFLKPRTHGGLIRGAIKFTFTDMPVKLWGSAIVAFKLIFIHLPSKIWSFVREVRHNIFGCPDSKWSKNKYSDESFNWLCACGKIWKRELKHDDK